MGTINTYNAEYDKKTQRLKIRKKNIYQLDTFEQNFNKVMKGHANVLK